MSDALLDRLLLPAQTGLRFLDAYSGRAIIDGLRCTLYRRRDRRALGVGVVTPSGVHHWPELAAPWRHELASPPAPPQTSHSEVIVEDRFDRYLPLRLPWPPEPDSDSEHITSVMLASAPQRNAPSGAGTVHGLLTDESGFPAAWVRVLATDTQSRTTVGMSDDTGRLTLHLPFPRPERRTLKSPPDSPPAAPTMGATITLRMFHDPDIGAEALAAAAQGNPFLTAPFLPGWTAQPEVRALARLGATDPFGPLRLEPDRPSVPVTEGLPPNRSELRLTPL